MSRATRWRGAVALDMGRGVATLARRDGGNTLPDNTHEVYAMKQKSILYLLGFLASLFLVVFPVPIVLAQSSKQIVPTATFIPPSLTPTPFDPGCPPGTPSGWGTYTPSPLWLLECEHCFWTATPTGITPTVTGTPPTATPTQPTPTNTPSVLPGGLSCGSITDGSCTVYDGGSRVSLVSLSIRNTASVWASWNMDSSLVGKSVWVNTYLYGAWDNTCGYDDRPPSWSWYLNGSSARFTPTYNPIDLGISASMTVNRLDEISVTAMGEGFSFLQMVSGWPCSYNTHSGIVDVYTYNPAVVTPTPSPTPFGPAYCGSVSPYDNGFGWDLFEEDGPPNCDLGWEEFSFLEYTIPPVEICLQPVKFGVVKLFGTEYEVGIFGLAIAAAFFWRFWRTI